MSKRKREFLSHEEEWKAIERIRNHKVKMIVRFFVERGCWLTLHGDGELMNVYNPKVGHNIIGNIAIDSEMGSFIIQLSRNVWKGFRYKEFGLNLKAEDFVERVIQRINAVA